jgi:hypothetical protein
MTGRQLVVGGPGGVHGQSRAGAATRVAVPGEDEVGRDLGQLVGVRPVCVDAELPEILAGGVGGEFPGQEAGEGVVADEGGGVPAAGALQDAGVEAGVDGDAGEPVEVGRQPEQEQVEGHVAGDGDPGPPFGAGHVEAASSRLVSPGVPSAKRTVISPPRSRVMWSWR